MQIILTQATVQTINAGAAELAQIITGETPDIQSVKSVTDMANWSITATDTTVTYEVNDEVFTKYLAVYLKIARVVAPFVKPVMALIDTLNTDVRDIQCFMDAKK